MQSMCMCATLVGVYTRLRGHRGDGLGFNAGLFRDRQGDGGVGGASGADAAGASLQQLLHVIQLCPCNTIVAQTMLTKYNTAISMNNSFWCTI